jgi:uncharacterized membrane protein
MRGSCMDQPQASGAIAIQPGEVRDRMSQQEPPRRGAGDPSPYTREEMDYILAGIGTRRRAFSATLAGAVDGAGDWLRRHWLACVNGAVATYVGLAYLTPVLFSVGADGPASAIFRAYRVVCDELPTHSLYVGGYQACLCARCTAIYTSMLLVGLALAVLRRTRVIHGLRWWMWGIAMTPMALDGFTQLFGLRESNVWLRLLTGAIFGIATAAFTLPQLEAAARMESTPAPAAAPPRR